MGSVNHVILVGHLGREAELRHTSKGEAVATMSLATTETWKDKGGQKQERTEWHRVVLWGAMAESLHSYLVTGKQLYIEGKIQTRKWQDKDGADRFTTEIRGERVVLLGGGERKGSAAQSPSGGAFADSMPDDTDIPFAWLLPFALPLAGLLCASLS